MFSDLLNTFRLKADVYNNAQFCGNWTIHAHSTHKTCFHMVTLGRCQMNIPGQPSIALEPGDLVIFPREIPHSMTPYEDSKERSYGLNTFPPTENKHGTGLLCGTLEFEHVGFNHVLDALPTLFIIQKNEAPWLAPLFEQIRFEVLQTGGADESVLNRLSELLFVYALRHQLQHQEPSNFLSLFASQTLQPALAVMKDEPHKQWSLEALAQKCAMSRTKFSQLFKQTSGLTVNTFFTWWRMQLAYDFLRQGQRITHVAEKVGYQSESAFSRAFKKCFEINPSDVRL